jgi:hypothetical protein
VSTPQGSGCCKQTPAQHCSLCWCTAAGAVLAANKLLQLLSWPNIPSHNKKAKASPFFKKIKSEKKGFWAFT